MDNILNTLLFSKTKRIEKGIEKGIGIGKEQGIVQGIEIGKEQGITQGIEIGKEQRLLNVARLMKNSGIAVEQINFATNLSLEQIKNL